MKILHAPYNIGNHAWMISRAQRKMGHHSDVLMFKDANNLKFDYDICISFSECDQTIAAKRFFINLLQGIIYDYDVYHFHYGASLIPGNWIAWLPEYWDLPILKSLCKKIVFHFAGCDIRIKEIEMKSNKFSVCRSCDASMYCDSEVKLKRLKTILQFADAIIVHPIHYNGLLNENNSFHVPYAFDLAGWQPSYPDPNKERPLVIHAPTSRTIKGTGYVLDAVEKLKNEGIKFQFLLIENMPYDKVKEIYREADIFVDQLLVGTHGGFSLEGMALGKPVLCYIREDVAKHLESCPIVNVNPVNIYNKLKELIGNANLRQKLGLLGRKYMEDNHDSLVIADKYIKIYSQSNSSVNLQQYLSLFDEHKYKQLYWQIKQTLLSLE